MQAARVDMISAEPAWFVETMVESVTRADLEKLEVRTALVKILDSRVLGTTSDMEAKVTSTPLAELSGQEVVLKKGLEARTINQKIEAEAQEAKLKAEYEERMKTAWDRKMAAAVTDGREQFKEHFEGGNSYGVRFKDYGEGSSHLANLLKDWNASAEVTGDHRLARVDGYLQVLENIMETPGYLDKFVAREAEIFYTGLGGKSKTDYEREGKILEWNEHIRRQILTEIHGNALGILLGAVEYEGRSINDEIRVLTLRRSLEVLGRGQALEGLIAGKGDLTPEQTLIRKALLEYVKKPIGAQEKLGGDEQVVTQRRLARLKGLKDAASQADITILQKREGAKKLARLKAKEEESRRGNLKNKVGKSQEHLRTIDEAKEKMLDAQAKGQRIEGLSDVVVDYVLKIDRQDKSKPPTINVSVNEARTKEFSERIRVLKGELAKNPSNSRELRDELAMREVDIRFIQEVREWVNSVNGSSYKRVFMEAGLFGKSKGAILVTAFDSIPDPGSDQRWYGYNDEITEAQQEVDQPRATSDRQKPKTLAELKQQVDAQTQAENLLESYGDVDQTERELFDRVTQAKEATDIILQRSDKAVVSLARDFVKRRLEGLLRSERRLSYS